MVFNFSRLDEVNVLASGATVFAIAGEVSKREKVF
jgi:hypothetical protein